MQSPVSIINDKNSAVLQYGIIERGSNGVAVTPFISTTERDCITTITGSDPIIKLPSIVSQYRFVKVKINARAVWYMPSLYIASALAIYALPIIAYNNVSAGALLIQHNGTPIQNVLTENSFFYVNNEPGTIDFSSFTVRYSIPNSLTVWGTGPDTTPTTNILQVFLSVIVTASNGTN